MGTRGVRILFLTGLVGAVAWVGCSSGGGGGGGGGTTPATKTVTVSPGSVSVGAGASQTFTAGTTGLSASTVVWSLAQNGSGGSINATTGAYTAGSTAGVDVVRATSAVDPSISGTATVTVTVTTRVPTPTATTSATTGAVAAKVRRTAGRQATGSAQVFIVVGNNEFYGTEGATGDFAWGNLDPALYNIGARQTGYQEGSKEVSIQANLVTDGGNVDLVPQVNATTGGIRGVVKNAQGAVVSGAIVGLWGKPGIVQTDANGAFSFFDLTAGSYTVAAQHAVQGRADQAVTVTAGQDANVTITLAN